MLFQASSLLALLPSLVAAVAAPGVPGFQLIWSDDFAGAAGSSPSTSNWNIMTAIDTNNEVESYTTSSSNVQLSGGQTVQLIPRKSSSGAWTSGRIESKGYWTPTAGKVMLIQSTLRLGDNPTANKQGIWPAFWTLGQAVREGTPWPTCGELDIMEQINGVMTGHGTAHCGTSSGGPCDETTGRTSAVALPNDDWNTWSLKIDLTNGDWTAQTISWMLNGNVYGTLTGASLGDQATWATLAHSPLYILLNVAVGGNWPGAPNSATMDGYGSMMEVEYVAVYST